MSGGGKVVLELSVEHFQYISWWRSRGRILAGATAGFVFILNLMDEGFLRMVIVRGENHPWGTGEGCWTCRVTERARAQRRGWEGPAGCGG